ncbi:hypothetical protein GDO86_011196 [Hymenochirus boettgeri]|uniref:Uncharacterized protein n=1 Tax=Hymenochirus boettgeri TaxID=247094 RepID=A0A8T2JFF4_9PIPI|nr:hypothetical protein GDO86_011196 [Hymenochirus boettgeri]
MVGSGAWEAAGAVGMYSRRTSTRLLCLDLQCRTCWCWGGICVVELLAAWHRLTIKETERLGNKNDRRQRRNPQGITRKHKGCNWKKD